MHLARFLTLVAALAFLALPLAGCGDDNGDNGGDPVAEGDELFHGTGLPSGSIACSDCHGETGMGDGPLAPSYTPPPTDLTTYAGSEDEIRTAVTMGVGDMPGYPDLTSDQVDALIAYVMSLR